MSADQITEAEVDSLPLPPDRFLRSYINYASQLTDAHKAYHIIAGLGILAQTCPIEYAFPFGTPMYSHFYGLCIGRSTDSRKSASLSIAQSLLEEVIPNTVGEMPGSKEALVDSLRMNPRQAIVYGEFGAFLASAEKGYMMPLKTTYTEAWDGRTIGRSLVRKTKGEMEAKNPRLTLLCGSTLDFLERHTEPADWMGGFMSRFLTFYLDRERTWSIPPGASQYREAMTQWIRYFTQWGTLDQPIGHCLGFTDEAAQLWTAWYEQLGRRAQQAQANEVAGGIMRTHAHALKIALLLAWDAGIPHTGQDWKLPANVLVSALRIADFHVRSMLRVGRNLATSKDMRERQAVLAAIGAEPIAVGQIMRKAKLLKRRTSEIIETLLEEGVIKSDNTFDLARGICYRLSTPEELAEMFAPPTPRDVTTLPPSLAVVENGSGAQIIQFPSSSSPSAPNVGGGTTGGTGGGSAITFDPPVLAAAGAAAGFEPAFRNDSYNGFANASSSGVNVTGFPGSQPLSLDQTSAATSNGNTPWGVGTDVGNNDPFGSNNTSEQ